jgi:hypothetical protein
MSVVAGTTLFAMLAVRRSPSPLLRHFALQTSGLGLVVAVLGAAAWRGVALRDFAAATRLERWLWVAICFEIVLVAIGLSVATFSWVTGRRLGGIGAGVGMIVQGLALLALDLDLVSILI